MFSLPNIPVGGATAEGRAKGSVFEPRKLNSNLVRRATTEPPTSNRSEQPEGWGNVKENRWICFMEMPIAIDGKPEWVVPVCFLKKTAKQQSTPLNFPIKELFAWKTAITCLSNLFIIVCHSLLQPLGVAVVCRRIFVALGEDILSHFS